MEFEYAEQLEKLPNCPGHNLQRCCVAFRFVHEDRDHKNNFLPPKIIKPNRKLPEDEDICCYYALSLYESEDEAITDYNEILNVCPQFHKQVGSYLASVELLPTHGVTSSTDAKGHFDLHPFKGVSFCDASQWLGPIKIL